MHDNDDWIHLRRFSFPCILGLYDREQRTSQALAVEISMGLDLDPAAGGTLDRSVDYAATLEQVKFIAEHGRWRMLESMATAMARHLLAIPAAGEERAQVSRAVVILSKPDFLEGRAVPSVEIRRDRAWCASTTRTAMDGAARIEVLQESLESGAYRVHLDPGTAWKPPPGMHGLIVAGRAVAGGRELAAGASLVGEEPALEASGPKATCVLVVGERSRRG